MSFGHTISVKIFVIFLSPLERTTYYLKYNMTISYFLDIVNKNSRVGKIERLKNIKAANCRLHCGKLTRLSNTYHMWSYL